MQDVKDQISSYLSHRDIHFYRAPGRINLIGEHTDYNGGLVMPGAIDRYMYFGFAFNQSDEITFHAIDLNESVVIPLHELKAVKEEWANYLIGNLYILSQEGKEFSGFECAFTSDIPLGAGMSSSSALECCFLYGMNDLFDLGLSNWDMVHNSHRSNHQFLGVKGGILDQFASIFSQQDELLMLNCDSHEFKKVNADFGDYSLLLINTNVKHNHINSGYNDRVAECQSALKSIQQHYPEVNTLSDIENTDSLSEVTFESSSAKSRAIYISEENKRVLELAEALEGRDHLRCGALLYEGHDGLSSLYEVSCSELDFLVDLFREDPNVLGSRMMGGGFGGCTINIVKKGKQSQIVEIVKEKYSEKFDLTADIYEVRLVDGAQQF